MSMPHAHAYHLAPFRSISQVEVDVGVQRIQRGLVLNLSQLSPVLRLRQD